MCSSVRRITFLPIKPWPNDSSNRMLDIKRAESFLCDSAITCPLKFTTERITDVGHYAGISKELVCVGLHVGRCHSFGISRSISDKKH